MKISRDNKREFYRIKHILEMFGIHRATLWLWVKKGDFPKPVAFGAGKRLKGWPSEDIEAYLEKIKGREVG